MHVQLEPLRHLAFPGGGVDRDLVASLPAGQGDAQHVPLQPPVREVPVQTEGQRCVLFAVHGMDAPEGYGSRRK